MGDACHAGSGRGRPHRVGEVRHPRAARGTRDASDPRRVCYIFSDVRNPDDNTVLAAVGLRYIGPDNKTLLSFQLLPSIDPAYGLRFAVDDGPILEGDVHGCDELKCLVVGQVTDDLLRSLKAGNWLILSFKLGDQPSRLDVSLLGFTRASAELSRLQREP